MQTTYVFFFYWSSSSLELFLHNINLPIAWVFCSSDICWSMSMRSVGNTKLLHLGLEFTRWLNENGSCEHKQCVQRVRNSKRHTRVSDSNKFPSQTSCINSLLSKMVKMTCDYFRNALLLQCFHFLVLYV